MFESLLSGVSRSDAPESPALTLQPPWALRCRWVFRDCPLARWLSFHLNQTWEISKWPWLPLNTDLSFSKTEEGSLHYRPSCEILPECPARYLTCHFCLHTKATTIQRQPQRTKLLSVYMSASCVCLCRCLVIECFPKVNLSFWQIMPF